MNEPQLLKIKEAEFLFGSPSVSAIRKQNLPEIAVIGRSNVGKSSFINRISGRKLARVSGTPGCTRQLNFFQLRGEFGNQAFDLALVDMPGFGFAKLSKQEREQISRLTVDYMRDRRQVRAVILLSDCRRSPGDDEFAIQRLCADEGLTCLIVATKVDTLKTNEKKRTIAELAKAYGLEPDDIVTTGTGISPAQIWDRLLAALV